MPAGLPEPELPEAVDAPPVRSPGVTPAPWGSRSRKGLTKIEQQHEIMAGRLAGKPMVEVADSLGIRPKTAQRLLDEALALRAEPIERVREVELARLEDLAATFYQRARGGDEKAAAAYVKVHDRIAKISGITAPKRVEVNGRIGVNHTVDAAVLFEVNDDLIDAAMVEYANAAVNPLNQRPVLEAVVVEDAVVEDGVDADEG